MPTRTVFERIKIDVEKEQEEAKRHVLDIDFYCTKRECLIKLVKLETENKTYPVYQCNNCKEKFKRNVHEYTLYSLDGTGRKEWSRDYREIKELKLSREQYISEAKELRTKLQFLEEWERQSKT